LGKGTDLFAGLKVIPETKDVGSLKYKYPNQQQQKLEGKLSGQTILKSQKLTLVFVLEYMVYAHTDALNSR